MKRTAIPIVLMLAIVASSRPAAAVVTIEYLVTLPPELGPPPPSTLRISGIVTSEKTLSIYGYVGDGQITAADFIGGGLVGSVQLFPDAVAQVIDFDITSFLLGLPNDAEFFGFNLRETESVGNVVTLEYLVLATFLGLGTSGFRVDGHVAPVALGTAPVIGQLVGTIQFGSQGSPLPISNHPDFGEVRGAVEFAIARVPEPTSLAIWGVVGLGGAFYGWRRRRRAAA